MKEAARKLGILDDELQKMDDEQIRGAIRGVQATRIQVAQRDRLAPSRGEDDVGRGCNSCQGEF